MADYSHLKKMEVQKDATVEFEFYELDTSPVLLVKCTVGNDEYQKRIRAEREPLERKLKKKTKSGRKRQNLNTDLMKLLREPDRRHYPGSVVVGWSTNKDANGDEVEYSDDECEQFLAALPDYLFDRLRYFVIEPKHFTDMGMSPEDEDDLAGN